MRRPPYRRWLETTTPSEVAAWFVTFCVVIIVATLLMIMFFPWSIPVWMVAILAIGYALVRALTNLTNR